MEDDGLKRFSMRMPEDMYAELKEISKKTYIPVSKLILLACVEYLERRKNSSN